MKLATSVHQRGGIRRKLFIGVAAGAVLAGIGTGIAGEGRILYLALLSYFACGVAVLFALASLVAIVDLLRGRRQRSWLAATGISLFIAAGGAAVSYVTEKTVVSWHWEQATAFAERAHQQLDPIRVRTGRYPDELPAHLVSSMPLRIRQIGPQGGYRVHTDGSSFELARSYPGGFWTEVLHYNSASGAWTEKRSF